VSPQAIANGWEQLGAVDGNSVLYGWLTLIQAYRVVGVLCYCYKKGSNHKGVATFRASAFVYVNFSAVEGN